MGLILTFCVNMDGVTSDDENNEMDVENSEDLMETLPEGSGKIPWNGYAKYFVYTAANSSGFSVKCKNCPNVTIKVSTKSAFNMKSHIKVSYF